LPLDLLARHRLARGDLGGESTTRSEALREWFGDLASEMSALLATPKLGVLRAAMAAADAKRLASAAKAGEPMKAMTASLTGLSIPIAWAAWRAARRSRR
jgi:hypothetical protein